MSDIASWLSWIALAINGVWLILNIRMSRSILAWSKQLREEDAARKRTACWQRLQKEAIDDMFRSGSH